jgi:hypothetical protein
MIFLLKTNLNSYPIFISFLYSSNTSTKLLIIPSLVFLDHFICWNFSKKLNLAFKKILFFPFQFAFGVILGFITKLHFFFRPILVPTCALLPIMILSLKITFIHSHHILHLLFYKSWQMNKIDYLLHQLKLKEQYIPHIGSHIVITMNIVLIQFWHFFSKYLLLLLWLIALLTNFFALDMVDWLINNEIIY